ncbi:MAG: DUF4236 domain-containing protein [Pseudonocardia sp.]|nr:DUF4236 domain-containing protein [Pseudonocardia sp.]
MKFRARRTVRIGPLRLHFTQAGFSSWGLKIGPWTWNARTGRHSFDTPGPGGITWGGHRRSER